MFAFTFFYSRKLEVKVRSIVCQYYKAATIYVEQLGDVLPLRERIGFN